MVTQVVIYSSDLTNLYNVTGEQVGAYFGYSLCVLDTDGDGLDDIVIGAPMFTDYNDAAMKIETGRVYVVYQNTVSQNSRTGIEIINTGTLYLFYKIFNQICNPSRVYPFSAESFQKFLFPIIYETRIPEKVLLLGQCF